MKSLEHCMASQYLRMPPRFSGTANYGYLILRSGRGGEIHRKQTSFATQHSVKGAEFENVLVVLGGGWNHYNWPLLLELINTKSLNSKNTQGFTGLVIFLCIHFSAYDTASSACHANFAYGRPGWSNQAVWARKCKGRLQREIAGSTGKHFSFRLYRDYGLRYGLNPWPCKIAFLYKGLLH